MTADLAALIAFIEARLAEEEPAEVCGCYDTNHWPPCTPRPETDRRRREIAFKRHVLELYTPPDRGEESDDELHARCAHPAYEYAITQGQRKAWADADTPPEGGGWERNVTAADPDGWERFDYHEESYWRRQRPGGPRPSVLPAPLLWLAAIWNDHPGYRQEWKP